MAPPDAGLVAAAPVPSQPSCRTEPGKRHVSETLTTACVSLILSIPKSGSNSSTMSGRTACIDRMEEWASHGAADSSRCLEIISTVMPRSHRCAGSLSWRWWQLTTAGTLRSGSGPARAVGDVESPRYHAHGVRAFYDRERRPEARQRGGRGITREAASRAHRRHADMFVRNLFFTNMFVIIEPCHQEPAPWPAAASGRPSRR